MGFSLFFYLHHLTWRSWLVRLFFHFDANFQLVLTRHDNRDPGEKSLWSGPGFFVNTDLYQQYLMAAGEVPQEVSKMYVFLLLTDD